MASDALKKFAAELKFVRESQSISLQQIAGKTKIDMKFLQAIEDANFEILPDLYIKAFIKEYSQMIDLDPKETLNKYDAAKSGKLEEKLPEIIPEEEKINEPELKIQATEPALSNPSPKSFNTEETFATQPDILPVQTTASSKTNYIIGGLISVIALLLIYFAFYNGSSSEIVHVESDPMVNSPKSERFELGAKTSDRDLTNDQSQTDAAQFQSDSLHLSIVTTDRVWLKVSADSKILQQGIFEANSRLRYASIENFSLSIGNAGRVKVYFNNKPVENVGLPGEIRNLFITSNGIKYYTIPPRKNEEKSTTTN